MTNLGKKLRKWTPDEVKTLYRMLEAGRMHKEIAAVLNMDAIKVKFRVDYERQKGTIGPPRKKARRFDQELRSPTPFASKTDRVVVSPEAMADRNRRLQVSPRDLTAVFMGDPLPGFSALERRA